jgi:hypothetical protein
VHLFPFRLTFTGITRKLNSYVLVVVNVKEDIREDSSYYINGCFKFGVAFCEQSFSKESVPPWVVMPDGKTFCFLIL